MGSRGKAPGGGPGKRPRKLWDFKSFKMCRKPLSGQKIVVSRCALMLLTADLNFYHDQNDAFRSRLTHPYIQGRQSMLNGGGVC